MPMVTRSALPQNYVKSAGTVIDNMDSATWSVAGNGTKEAGSVFFGDTAESTKLNVTTAGSAANLYKNTTLDMSQRGSFSFWVYLSSPLPATIQIVLSNSAGLSHYFQYDLNAGAFFAGWNQIILRKSDFFVGGGTPSWNTNIGRIYISAYAGTGLLTTITVDDMRYDREQVPRCLITFDDSTASSFTEGYTYMQARGVRGTWYVPPGALNISLANLQVMYANGHAIANHTMNHINLPTLATQAEMEAEIQGCIDYLIENDMPRAAYHFAYPGGGYNATAKAACAACGLLTARTVHGALQHAPATPDMYELFAVTPTKTTTLASLKTYVDNSIKTGKTLVLCFHSLVESVSDTYDWAISDFQALIDYIVARKIKCVTIDEWYEGLTNPRYRSLPVGRA
jgi:peptidoglycan/xylan/chitin deacetylase (PgdA/CDA1 family)